MMWRRHTAIGLYTNAQAHALPTAKDASRRLVNHVVCACACLCAYLCASVQVQLTIQTPARDGGQSSGADQLLSSFSSLRSPLAVNGNAVRATPTSTRRLPLCQSAITDRSALSCARVLITSPPRHLSTTAMNAAIGGSASTNNYLGVTPPISIDPPKPAELRATEDLVACLRTMHVFESEDESQRRWGVSSPVWASSFLS